MPLMVQKVIKVSDARLGLPPLLNCLGSCLRAQLWYLPYRNLLPNIQRFVHKCVEAGICSDELLVPDEMVLSDYCLVTYR
ncbi:hypothetical protein IEQ34_017801 [Dendrobium chrysotoxum]|uniref:Uncharacterized protein n=1 Tax=Dendrobium chrysotoxum TaxID=161865 RepID=A0AAV7GB55_DENCH|nr:hypothetical protein IEQ34_017801 [Dendrobium chrysotoxum]